MCMGRLLRFDGRFPTARFAVFTARSLVPPFDSPLARKLTYPSFGKRSFSQPMLVGL